MSWRKRGTFVPWKKGSSSDKSLSHCVNRVLLGNTVCRFLLLCVTSTRRRARTILYSQITVSTSLFIFSLSISLPSIIYKIHIDFVFHKKNTFLNSHTQVKEGDLLFDSYSRLVAKSKYLPKGENLNLNQMEVINPVAK